MPTIQPQHSGLLPRARLLTAGAVLAVLAAMALITGQEPAAAELPTHPNIVLIQTDDQTLDQLYAAYTLPFGNTLRAMPNTLDLIAKRGVTFTRYYVSYPLCCPSRVTLLTGRYSHNNNVRGNNPPNAGYTGFARRAAMTHNIATWLHQDGYRTIHVGKFLNGYGDKPWDDGKTVPPGWDAWHSVLNSDTQHLFYGYHLNNNGAIDGPYGDPGSWATREWGIRDDIGCPFAPTNGLPCFHETDMLTQLATQEMLNTPAGKPFYLQVDYTAPHGDFRRPAGPEPTPRHYDWFNGVQLPHDRSQGLGEGNVNDKPRFIRDAPYLAPSDLHTYRVYYQKMLESLRDVDDGVKLIIQTLGGMHALRNTYVIFTSDNGFFFGEHRLIGGKFLAYEPATHLPFLMRGPGIRPNTRTGELSENQDVAPTILDLADATADKSIDGRSMMPFAQNPRMRTRRPLLFESFVETSDVEPSTARKSHTSKRALARGGASASIVAPPKDYEGIRLGPWKYIEWPTGEKELYNINRDPYELNSLHRIRNLYPIRNFMHRELRKLEDCVGRECLETTSKVPLTRRAQQRLQAQKRRERKRRQRQRRKKQKQAQK